MAGVFQSSVFQSNVFQVPVAVFTATLAVSVTNVTGLFVSTSGTAGGLGTIGSPFSLSFAGSGANGLIAAGSTVYVRGGHYAGPGTSTLSGTVDSPIIFRNYNGERVMVDGDFEHSGSYVHFHGIEFCDQSSDRIALVSGSDPTDIPGRYGIAPKVIEPGSSNKWINCTVHDTSNGIGDSDTVFGTEWTGGIVYNVGWHGPDRGHGHVAYIQNDTPTKSIIDCALFGSYDVGLQLNGTSNKERNLTFLGVSVWGAGLADDVFGIRNLMELYGGEDFYPNGNDTHSFTYCSFYQPSSLGAPGLTFSLNQTGSVATPINAVTFDHNIVHGSNATLNACTNSSFQNNKITTGTYNVGSSGDKVFVTRLPSGAVLTTNTVDNNDYYSPDWAAANILSYQDGAGVGHGYNTLALWRTATGYDLSSTLTAGVPTGSDIIVRPSSYETGRALITCWNWDLAASLNVDVSTSGLATNDKYVVHHVYDLFGAPVASGTWDGSSTIALTQTGYTSPKPIGYDTVPTYSDDKFNVFLLRKVSSTSLPSAAPSGLAAVTASSTAINLTWTDNSNNEIGFIVERQQAWDSDGAVGSDWIVDSITLAGVTSCTSTGLTASTNYVYRVRAYTEAGYGDASSTANDTTSAAGAPFVNDTMTDIATTPLTAHVGETGATWAKNSTQTGDGKITAAGRVRPSTTGNVFAYTSGTPATADYDIQADFYVATTGVTDRPGLCGRMSTTTAQCYLLRYEDTAWKLYRLDPTAGTALIDSFAQTLTAGVTYQLKLTMRGTTIRGYVDGALRCSGTDAVITATGKAGIRFTNHGTPGDAVGLQIDNFTATDA